MMVLESRNRFEVGCRILQRNYRQNDLQSHLGCFFVSLLQELAQQTVAPIQLGIRLLFIRHAAMPLLLRMDMERQQQ